MSKLVIVLACLTCIVDGSQAHDEVHTDLKSSSFAAVSKLRGQSHSTGTLDRLRVLAHILSSLNPQAAYNPHGMRPALGSPIRTGMRSAVLDHRNCCGRHIEMVEDGTGAKVALLAAIDDFNTATAADGVPSIDFGVKGGELDGDSRAPRDLYKAGAYHAVSPRVGAAADAVVAAVDLIGAANPTLRPTEYFGTKEGMKCPLHGSWSNIWTTAADAVFSEDSERGDAKVYNEVNGVSGKTMNVIEYLPRKDGKPPPVKTFRVRLSATAVSDSRVELIFRYVKVRLNRFFGLPFGFTLFIPVPGPTLTKILFAFRKNKRPPPAYFDVLYLDSDLRVHRTGQGNIFVQRRRT